LTFTPNRHIVEKQGFEHTANPCLNVFNIKSAPYNGQNMCLQRIGSEEVISTMGAHFHEVWQQHRKAG
jgi:hypothetical protein